MRPTLIVFARALRLGQVKTRLARGLGAVEALRIYRLMLTRTLRVAEATGWRVMLAVTPDPPPRHGVVEQGRGDLGARMDRALRKAPPGPALIIGTDCPALSRRSLRHALKQLGGADAVFGPGTDGGYWLIGLKRIKAQPRLLRAVRWSGPHALEDSRAGLPRTWRIASAETLADVDTSEDWAREKAQLSFPSAGA